MLFERKIIIFLCSEIHGNLCSYWNISKYVQFLLMPLFCCFTTHKSFDFDHQNHHFDFFLKISSIKNLNLWNNKFQTSISMQNMILKRFLSLIFISQKSIWRGQNLHFCLVLPPLTQFCLAPMRIDKKLFEKVMFKAQ